MNVVTHRLHAVAENVWLVFFSALASILSFLVYLYEKYTAEPTSWSVASLIVSLAVLAIGYLYSIRVRSENIALREVAAVFCEINHIYRDVLGELFSEPAPVASPADLLDREQRTLESVCQHISRIFMRLTGRDCMVTVKLVTEKDNRHFAVTYVRSMSICERDQPQRKPYELGTNENTALDVAVHERTDGKPSHFFSADLTLDRRKNAYRTQRQDFQRFYKSLIVVPIRGIKKASGGNRDRYNTVGFLCVDTLSRHRLNDGYHVYILCSLAGQMYNFLSLMRGKYRVVVE